MGAQAPAQAALAPAQAAQAPAQAPALAPVAHIQPHGPAQNYPGVQDPNPPIVFGSPMRAVRKLIRSVLLQ
jgi:hypothetical protein